MKKIYKLTGFWSNDVQQNSEMFIKKINEIVDFLQPEGEKCGVFIEQIATGKYHCNEPKGSCPVHEKPTDAEIKHALKDAWYVIGDAEKSPQPVSTVEGWRKDFLLTFYVYNLKKGSPAGAHLEAVEFIENIIAQVRTDERARAYKTVRNFIGRQRVGNSWTIEDLLKELK